MVQTSNTSSLLYEMWMMLYKQGLIQLPPTECGRQCDQYARRKHTVVFLQTNSPPFRCDMCGRLLKKDRLIVDHRDRIHNGFGFHNCPENLRALCEKCNHLGAADTLKWRLATDEEFAREYAMRSSENGKKNGGKGIRGKRWDDVAPGSNARRSIAAFKRHGSTETHFKCGHPRPVTWARGQRCNLCRKLARGTGNRVP